MAETWRYRGQEIDSQQLAFLKEFIRTHSASSRWKLSRQICEALGWKQANGALRDVVCRGLLLMLERAGQIQLPPGAPPHSRPAANWASAAGSGSHRHHTDGGAIECVRSNRDSAGAPHGG